MFGTRKNTVRITCSFFQQHDTLLEKTAQKEEISF